MRDRRPKGRLECAVLQGGRPSRTQPPSAYRRRSATRASRWSMLLVAETMFFAGLIGAYLVFRFGTPVWPPPNLPRLPLAVTWVNTLVLMASGLTMLAAVRAARRDDSATRCAAPGDHCAARHRRFSSCRDRSGLRLVHHGLTLSTGTYGVDLLHADRHARGARRRRGRVARRRLGAGAARPLRPAVIDQAVELCTIYWIFVCVAVARAVRAGVRIGKRMERRSSTSAAAARASQRFSGSPSPCDRRRRWRRRSARRRAAPCARRRCRTDPRIRSPTASSISILFLHVDAVRTSWRRVGGWFIYGCTGATSRARPSLRVLRRRKGGSVVSQAARYASTAGVEPAESPLTPESWASSACGSSSPATPCRSARCSPPTARFATRARTGRCRRTSRHPADRAS